MYQREVDLDMLNAVKIKLADVSSVSPSSEQRVKSVRLCLFTFTQNLKSTRAVQTVLILLTQALNLEAMRQFAVRSFHGSYLFAQNFIFQ